MLGTVSVRDEAYYGVHTVRAISNFPISGVPVSRYRDLVVSLAMVKQAAALANEDLGALQSRQARAINDACSEVRAGALHDQFVVDSLQGGAGTSTNMVANEVLANRGLELLGHAKGSYEQLHPIEHVNLGQSTNDVYPTALRLALHSQLDRLVAAVDSLALVIEGRAAEFDGCLKLGRTQLQDAVTMTVGQEFRAWATTLTEEVPRLREAQGLLRVVNLGGTAIGTSVNAVPGYRERVVAQLAEITELELSSAPDLVAATSDGGAYVAVSSVVKATSLKVGKICNDLRLLASGPTAGMAELNLPAMQSGSSIMPGKVNPVIPEAVNQVVFEVAGADLTVTLAVGAGQLQLNAFLPVVGVALFRSIEQLTAACQLLAEKCIAGLRVNQEVLQRYASADTALVTGLVPRVGYERATELLHQAALTGTTVREAVEASGIMTLHELDALFPQPRHDREVAR